LVWELEDSGWLTRVPALVDAVVDGPAGDGRDDDVHDEVQEQEGGRHGPLAAGRHCCFLPRGPSAGWRGIDRRWL
jgi:hypothetical protein